MAIRITGMYSGLDTESIISELASAQSVKKNKLVKAQTKLSWKQDAWKALNTKIFSFYTNVLGNMRFEGSYMKKATKVSNSNAVSVVTSADAPNSVQTMTVDKLARQGYTTGAQLKTADGKKVTASTTMEELGFTDNSGSFRVKVGNKTTDIEITKDMKISDVITKLQAAGVNASFDAKNQRLFVNSKDSGAVADFTLTANDATGFNVLMNLGLMSAYDPDSSEAKEYAKWVAYGTDPTAEPRASAEADEVAKLIAAKKASTDSLRNANAEYRKRLDALFESNKELDKYDMGYDPENPPSDFDERVKKCNDKADALYEQLYGTPKKNADGSIIKDQDGNPVIETPGLQQKLDTAKQELQDANDKLLELKEQGVSESDPAYTAAVADMEAKTSAVAQVQSDFNKVNGHYSYVKAVANIHNAITDNEKTITDNLSYYVTDSAEEPILSDGKLQAKDKAVTEIRNYFTEKIKTAADYKDNADKAATEGKTAIKIDGRDAVITLNGVEYTNSKNTFEINGLTITAQQETKAGEEITLTTAEDTEGIYDMIKNFFTEYNKLINEMDALYNADSSKGYEPLLSEEKQGLADSEIEEWEKKIKDSLLRRDSTLRDVTDAMKTVMLQGTTVNGKKMYLSDFGINTLGFFNAADNEKGAYHINGDKDDAAVANEDDTLRAMIAADPTSVQKFFSGLSKNLYDTLTDKMKSVKDTSSAFTVYNDKTMQKEYDDYKDKISKEETKLNNLIDSWYSKFSAMETAMAKLQSKNNAVSSMFGG